MASLSAIRSILNKFTGRSAVGVDISRHFATMVKTKKFIYAKRFNGEPKETDFQLVEEELPPLKDGEVLSEAIFHSVDPYMRPYMERYPVGVTMIGGQIAKVIESKDKDYPVGATIFGSFGWQTRTIFKPSDHTDPTKSYVLPPFGKHPSSLGLGVLGMPGNTAYFGFLEICKPQAGEVVVVTGAAGAVGTLVGQIAKLKGCKVIVTDLPEDLRPSFIGLYFNEPDEEGHIYGPDAPQITEQVERVDRTIGRLLDGLEKRGILDDVNVIMVGDHGMVGTCPDRVIYLEDLAPWITIPTEWVDSYYPLWTIRPPPGVDVGEVFQNITKGLESGKVKNAEFMTMYLKEDLPARLHFSGSDRIQPIIGVLAEGYACVETRSESICGGAHGYDNAYLSMRTIFFARGPQFARGRKVPSFENVQLYNVITSILGISGAPNNGSSSFAENILLPTPEEHRRQSNSK